MTDKENFRAEIEKAYNEAQNRVKLVKDEYWEGKVDAYRNVLCIFDSIQEEPVSEDLDKSAESWIDDDNNTRGADYIDVTVAEYAFKAGARWQKQQFEKNRLKHCNSITNEQAELEQGFIDQHLDKYNRMPTYLDAIEYGIQFKEQQLIKEAKTGQLENGEDYLRIKCLHTSCRPQDDGKMVKLIIIKED